MVKLSEDGKFFWDGKNWLPYEEPILMDSCENEEQEDERYIPKRKFSEPPDWDVLELSEFLATQEFDSSAAAIRFHDPEHKQSVMSWYGLTWFVLMGLTGNLFLFIFSIGFAYVSMPIFLSLRESRFNSKRERTINERLSVLKEFYELEFQKQMDEANSEMASIQSYHSNQSSVFSGRHYQ